MQTQNRLLDDLARVATSALGVAAGMREDSPTKHLHVLTMREFKKSRRRTRG